MRRAILFAGLCVLCLFAPSTAHAGIAYAGTPSLTGSGSPDDFTNLLYINEGQPFDMSAAGGSIGVATEFNFWASRGSGVVTPFIAEALAANNFIVRAIGTTREGGTDWSGSGLQQFAFSDGALPTIQDGWVAGFMSSFPDGSGGGSPIPFSYSNVQGWLTASQDRIGGPTITLDSPPRTGDFATDVNAHGLRRYQFQIGVEVGFPEIIGGGQTYEQSFDGMAIEHSLPKGWSAENLEGLFRSVDSFGLRRGSLDGGIDNVDGIVNVGGSEGRFSSSDPSLRLATWTDNVDGNRFIDANDVIADSSTDRALGNARVGEDDLGMLTLQLDIIESPLKAMVVDWDLEIWGGQPATSDRGNDGGGYSTTLSVGNSEIYTATRSLFPGQFFDTLNDGAPSGTKGSTLINGNEHALRDITSGIIEVANRHGAVGNTIRLTFDANYGDNDKGWISAIDNVRVRALAPGDADANGVVDVADLLQLLGGQKFNQGVDGVTWAQGDFNADDQFNTGDLLAMLSFLSGTFPCDPYASEVGSSSDAIADVIVNSATGEVTVDLAGHTVSAVIIDSAAEIFSGTQPDWDTTSQFPSTLPGELGNVLFTSTASGVDELGVVISQEFLGRDKEFYLQDLDLNILIASEGGTLSKGNVIVVPEPSTWMLLGLGSLALMTVVRRRMALRIREGVATDLSR